MANHLCCVYVYLRWNPFSFKKYLFEICDFFEWLSQPVKDEFNYSNVDTFFLLSNHRNVNQWIKNHF